MPESRVTSVQTIRRAALTKTAADYDRFPLSYAKRVLGDTEMTSHMAQTFTGHGGFAQYLFRFKLRDSPTAPATPSKFRMCCTFSRTVICSFGSVRH
ncbi:hypothetical protein EVAR_40309_1 [Eumeta japonica]|uniref:Uncharacterized protein n=1 Tax=Eumeta variegata TaxID=151549 RepID=A0A4C1YA28_EUMVA|nr:hypothetical protein EVAR_40309_1 [Eumeta japonica]